jgi:hypothetical protein
MSEGGFLAMESSGGSSGTERIRRVSSIVLGAVFWGLSAAAHAAPASAPTIVLESTVGERPANAAQLIGPLLEELQNYGFTVKPAAIVQLLGPRAPRPGILDRGRTAAQLAEQIETGLDAFRAGRFKDAEEDLSTAVQLIRRNPALWVLDGSNSSLTYNAFVKLAIAQAQNGRAEDSVATMLDVVRMSSAPISQSDYGPRAEKLFKGAQKLAQTMGRGSLIVNVSDNHAVIFIDGVYRGIGRVAIGDLIPGVRRMFVQVGADGRQYEIPVQPNDESALDIDWQIDSTLTIDEPSAGFTFGSEAERAREGVYARQLARRWRSEKVIVVGLTRLDGNLALIGTVYPAGGSAARRASVAVSDGAAGVRSLARFLYDGTLSGQLNVIEHESGTNATSDRTPGGTELTLTSKLVLGVGAAAVLGSAASYALSNRDAVIYNDSKTYAVKFMVASTPVLGAGLYLSLRDTTTASRLTSALLGAGAASLIAGTALYVTDEDPDTTRRYYRNSATPGVIVGGVGLAMTGVGAFLWYRERGGPGSSTRTAAASTQKRTLAVVPAFRTDGKQLLVSCLALF